jgi:hypothetical protein
LQKVDLQNVGLSTMLGGDAGMRLGRPENGSDAQAYHGFLQIANHGDPTQAGCWIAGSQTRRSGNENRLDQETENRLI